MRLIKITTKCKGEAIRKATTSPTPVPLKKTKGFVVERTVDRLGRIVIPSDMRRMVKVDIGARVIITATDKGVLITPAEENE